MTDATVLDASAVLAWVDGDPVASALVDPVLDRGLLSAVNGGEVRYKLAERGHDAEALITDLVALGVRFVPFDDVQARRIPELRAIDRAARDAHQHGAGGRTGRLSLADLCCLALALERRASVITGDRHWSALLEHGLAVDITDYRR